MRVDLLMVEMGLVPSRKRAQDLIGAGRVSLRFSERETKPIKKASVDVDPKLGPMIHIESEPDSHDYVSRGGTKLQGALARLRLDVRDKCALDVGISTGGFTDCLLKAGARRVVGVDVGHDQLSSRLRNDSRIVHFEGVNARDLSQTPLLEVNDGQAFDLVVVDVSFISLTLVLPQVIQYLKGDGRLLALVKPQFEVGRENLGKNGIVKDDSLYPVVEEKIRRAVASSGLNVEDYFGSSIEGSDGNREFFVFAGPAQLGLGSLL